MSARLSDFRSADFEALLALWRRFYPQKYHVSPELFHRNTVGSPLFDWGASCVAVEGDKTVGFVAVKRSAARLYKGPDADVAHVNSIAFDNPEIGLDLMSYVKRVLTDRGHSRLIFGQDSDHIFPGCPADVRKLVSFFLVEGFVSEGEVHDLERDLGDYENPAKPVADAELRPLTKREVDSLDHFLKSNFPGRWHYDATQKAGTEGIENCIYGLFLGGELKGFAMIQAFGQCRPVNGAVWHPSLGESWGALGAIGVAADVRGKGYGNALLGSALDCLKSRGVRNCIIDWTGLVDFYGKHGFEVTRTYDTLALALDPA